MNKKREISSFLSYAHANANLVKTFRDLLIEQLNASRTYEYRFWQDRYEILVGTKWKTEIGKALDSCDFGLLLVTPAFLGSRFISEEELPKYVGEDAKPCIPVMLSDVNFRRHDLKGLDQLQIFKPGKSFSDCNATQKRKFVELLFDNIESRLDTIYSKR